jgi:hypothetical protein
VKPFSCIVSDPGWSFRDSLPGPKRGAKKHYRCSSADEIIRLHIDLLGTVIRAPGGRRPGPVRGDIVPGTFKIADCSILFLWRVASMQDEALAVANACGYKVKSEIIWIKPHIGMGHYVRNRHETCLICVRGTGISDLIIDHSIPSDFEAPTGRHSEKPAEFYRIVERLGKGPRLELFARQQRKGWTFWGDERGGDVAP